MLTTSEGLFWVWAFAIGFGKNVIFKIKAWAKPDVWILIRNFSPLFETHYE